jgi:large subunit ribosomal protein L29
MAKTAELRDMSDEQIHLTWKEASENLFRLRIQAQTEKLDAPTELKRHRRLIARCQTVLNERARGVKQESAAKKSSDKKAVVKS